MYFYIAKNGKFFHNSVKTEAVKNAEIRITACFDEDYNLVIYSIKRVAGTELTKLLKAIRKMIDYATEIGVHNIINDIAHHNHHFHKQRHIQTIAAFYAADGGNGGGGANSGNTGQNGNGTAHSDCKSRERT